MTDKAKDVLATLADEIIEINKANGWDVATPNDWHTGDKVPRLLCLVHSEVSEALEAFRKQDQVNFKEEIADVIIRLLDLMGGLGWGSDVLPEITAKLEKNRNRGHKHGGKKI